MAISVTLSSRISAFGSSDIMSIIRFSIPRIYQAVSHMVHCISPTDASP